MPDVKIRADEIILGDLIDLEGDAIADPQRECYDLTFQYAEVHEIDRETADCIALYTSCGGWAFPNDHLLTVLRPSSDDQK